jgi:hypothetical protein
MKRYLIALLAAVFAAGLWSGPSGAENLDIDELASLLVLPVITGGDEGNPLKGTRGEVILGSGTGGGQFAATIATVTNAGGSAIILKVDVISGDVQPINEPTKACQSDSLICALTARETTSFVFTPTDQEGLSRLDVECSRIEKTPGNTPALIVTEPPVEISTYVNTQNGIMVVSAADPACAISGCQGEVMSNDVLFGDAIVVDAAAGQAYSFGAIPFQAGIGNNNGDKAYNFNGLEYNEFPAALATNFLAPGVDDGGNSVQAELILFTLDFQVGSQPLPRVNLSGWFWNDDEEKMNWQHRFDCFEIVPLGDLSPFAHYYGPGDPRGLGSISGHVEIYVGSSGTGEFDDHDRCFGNGDNIRNRGAHGWLVQNAVQGDVLPGDEPVPTTPAVPVPNAAAWGRPLHQSTTDLTPNSGDIVTLDAEPGITQCVPGAS